MLSLQMDPALQLRQILRYSGEGDVGCKNKYYAQIANITLNHGIFVKFLQSLGGSDQTCGGREWHLELLHFTITLYQNFAPKLCTTTFERQHCTTRDHTFKTRSKKLHMCLTFNIARHYLLNLSAMYCTLHCCLLSCWQCFAMLGNVLLHYIGLQRSRDVQ